MRIKLSFLLFFIFLFTAGCRQIKNTDSELNLSFEDIQDGKPKGWYFHPQHSYLVTIDSKDVKSGESAISIEYTGDTVAFQPIFITFPKSYEGKEITLSGYIKTENITDGYAGLWMRIDPEIAFDNMHQNGVTGTTDWKKYEITLDMNPAKTQQIVIGGLLVGKGKMWLDDLQITIDGTDIKGAKIYEKKPLPAELDKAFHFDSNIVISLSKNFDSKENKTLVANLELLGKLWGFLKYHHPEVGKGNYNWDNELFRMLPEYLKANGTARRDEILLQWMEKYGAITECMTCRETSADAVLKPDFSWVENSNMSSLLKEKIKEIYRDRHQGEQFYVGLKKCK